MYGEGLIKGLVVTIKHYFQPKVTQLYPEVMPTLPASVKSSFGMCPEKCIACGICAAACPNKVITVSTGKDENNKKKLTGYEMNMQYCMFCGLCVESCPTNAMTIEQDFELSAYHRSDTKRILFQEKAAPEIVPEARSEN